MEIKVGDKVLIKSWKEMEAEFGLDASGDIKTECFFVREMRKYCNTVMTVDLISGDAFKTKEDEGEFFFVKDTIKRVVTDAPATTPQFKVGDLVRVKPWEELAARYGVDHSGRLKDVPSPGFVMGMAKHCGREYRVILVTPQGNFRLDGDGKFNFGGWALDVVEEKPLALFANAKWRLSTG